MMPGRNGHSPAGDLPDDHLLCRGLLGHQFEPYDVHVTRRDIQLSLQCRNCSTIRHQTLTKQGFLIPGQSRYEYPPGYTRKGQGRLTIDDRAEYRIASVNYYLKERKR